MLLYMLYKCYYIYIYSWFATRSNRFIFYLRFIYVTIVPLCITPCFKEYHVVETLPQSNIDAYRDE